MPNNTYHMDPTELFIHQLVNDSMMKHEILELDEVVKDLAHLNWLKQMLEINNMDFLQCVIDYRKNLIYHLENI